MRSKATSQLEAYRKKHPSLGDSQRGSMYGYFSGNPLYGRLHIISSGKSSSVTDWEHVSVSCENRCPTWEEMSYVKDLFWLPTELVLQFHPPRVLHINCHPFCLHLWRDPGQDIRLPPSWMVGPKG